MEEVHKRIRDPEKKLSLTKVNSVYSKSPSSSPMEIKLSTDEELGKLIRPISPLQLKKTGRVTKSMFAN